MSEQLFLTLQDRGRANVGGLAEHDPYLMHREPDGTLIWKPAEVLSATEVRMLADEGLRMVIAANRADQSRLTRRGPHGRPTRVTLGRTRLLARV